MAFYGEGEARRGPTSLGHAVLLRVPATD
jgi:hypothetical protein